ncbi:MAG: carbon-nitrogen hydrolase family protein [Phycisphaerae bacterium]
MNRKTKLRYKDSLRVGAAQVIDTGDPDSNLKRVADFFGHASQKSVEVICFPEAIISCYDLDHVSECDEQYARRVKANLKRVKELCTQYHLWTVIGSVTPDSKQWRNEAYLIDKTGKIKGRCTKIHTLEGRERKLLAQGNRIPIFHVKGVKAGILICNDQKYFEPWYILATRGCAVVFHPMWGNGPAGLNPYENGTQMCWA